MTQRSQHGTVTLPPHGTFPALVDVDSDHATATLFARPLQPLTDAVGTEASIDIATRRGLLHIDAQVVDVPAGEVLELRLTGDMTLIQRRDYARVDAFLEVFVTPVPSDDKIPAAVVNISASGAVISRLKGMEPGDEARLLLQLAPYEPPLEIVGRVVRAFHDAFRALHFEQIQESDRERIVRFVVDRQRLELRYGAA